jgi:hypothetical protein
MLLDEGGIGLARDTRNDILQGLIALVAILILRPRREIERLMVVERDYLL